MRKRSLFFIDDWEKDYLTLPSDCKESFRLKVSGASDVKYVAVENGVNVSETGLITPKVKTFYWYGGVGYSWKMAGTEPDEITHEVQSGMHTVVVEADSYVFRITVNVYDYGEYYAEKAMDKFVSDNIRSGMTTEQKLDAIAKYVASKEYDASYSSATGMIVSGGGDCWASTDVIIKLAKKCGLDAWERNANRDFGAGSGHMNAMVYDGKNYYEVEAGYAEKAPRGYTVKKRTSLFSTVINGDYFGYEVYQYDGKTTPANLTIPETIDGKNVVAIGSNFLIGDEKVESVTLPSTIQMIGTGAFQSCTKLKSLNIPASVVSIGEFVFTGCNSLTNINASGNYSFEGGGLYDNEGTLLYAPCAKTMTIKAGTKKIGDYSFYYNKNITELTIPESVVTIGEGAFGECEALKKLTISGKGLKAVQSYAFANSGLSYVVLPESVLGLGDYVNYGLSDFTLIGKKGSAVETYAAENNIPFVDANGTKAYSIDLKTKNLFITEGTEYTMKYELVPSTVRDPITWTSSDTSVVTVSGGKIKAVSMGSATVTAKTASGVQDVCNINVFLAPVENKSTISATTITLGKSVKISAAASGGKGGYLYAVYYKKASSEKYSLVKDFSSDTSFTIKPKAAVDYDIKVIAKSPDSEKQSIKVFRVTVKKPLSNDSVLGTADTIKLGSAIKVTAKASGGTAPYTYGVYYKKSSSDKWSTAQKYSTKTSVSIKPAAAVKYDVCVKVKDSTGTIVKKYFTVYVKK